MCRIRTIQIVIRAYTRKTSTFANAKSIFSYQRNDSEYDTTDFDGKMPIMINYAYRMNEILYTSIEQTKTNSVVLLIFVFFFVKNRIT